MFAGADTEYIESPSNGELTVEEQAAQETELSDATLEAVAGGGEGHRKFYPLAELFRMITGIR